MEESGEVTYIKNWRRSNILCGTCKHRDINTYIAQQMKEKQEQNQEMLKIALDLSYTEFDDIN